MSKRVLDMPNIEAFIVPAPLLITTRYTRVVGVLQSYTARVHTPQLVYVRPCSPMTDARQMSDGRRKLRLFNRHSAGEPRATAM